MKKKFAFLIWICIFIFLSQEIKSSKLNSKINTLNNKELKKRKFVKDSKNLSEKESNNIVNFLAENIDDRLLEKNDNSFNLEITSDIQTTINNNFTAEGNVYVKKGNFKLSAEKLEYNLKSKDLLVQGNIIFIIEDQFLKASEIRYDLKKKKGIVLDAYGTLNFETLGTIKINEDISEDLNLLNIDQQKISKVTLNKSSSIKFENIKLKEENKSTFQSLGSQTIKLDLNEMEKWRFKAKKIEIDDNVWFSEELFLTNDPFNKPQLLIKNKGFKTINEGQEIIIKTNWSSLILDDFITIPSGPRRIKIDEDNNFKWGISYDKESKDGLYIIRNFDPLIYGKNTKLNLKKEFYLQRILTGKTKSFSKKNESIFAPKVEQDLKTLDYFGIEADLTSKFNGLVFNSNIELNSLDFDKFKKIISVQSELSKKLNKEKKRNSERESELSLFGTYREKVWNGTLGQKEILSAYGIKFEKNNNWITNDVFKSSKIVLLFGDYKSTARLETTKLIDRNRLNLYLERNNTYPIWKSNLKQNFINEKDMNSPIVIPKGLNFVTYSKLDFYRYEDKNFQNIYTFKGGPELTIGNFKKDFLDYTRIGILPKTVISKGNSPFEFDQSTDNHGIELNIKQQFIGPLALKYSTEYNLDVNSNKYKTFYNSIYEISWNRRAYNLAGYYNSETKTGGLTFKINSFNFDGHGETFD